MAVAVVALAAAVAHGVPPQPIASGSSTAQTAAEPAPSASNVAGGAVGTAGSEAAFARAPWPPPPLDELPGRDPARAAVDRAWRLPAGTLAERVQRTRRAGMALGLRDLDGPARALLFLSAEGDERERARLAIDLAPRLPAAHASLARSELDAGNLPAAWNAFHAAIRATAGHIESRAWAAAAASEAAVYATLMWTTLFALLGAAASIPNLTYGLGATRIKLPGPSALAGIGAVVMGLALAEGPAGAVLGLGAVAMASGSTTKRAGVLASFAVGLLALYAGLEHVAAGRLLLVADPVALAAHRIEAALPTPAELGTALRAAPTDLDAARAIALHAKRAGDRDAAAQYFARAIAARPDASTLNNAGNVAFARRDLARAIRLYEQATQLEPSANSYFNLSQAYGQAIRLDEQDRALAKAQSLDAEMVERLSGASANDEPFVSDEAFSAEEVATRVWATPAPKVLAALLRERVAPGWLGSSLEAAALLTLIVLALAAAGGGALARLAGPRDFYADLARTLRAGVGDSALRVAQLNRMRAQRGRTERLLTLIALVVPGAAGFRFGRPLAALVASAAFASGVAVAAVMLVAPPDPMAVGALPVLVAQLASVACAFVYATSTAAAFVLRAEE